MYGNSEEGFETEFQKLQDVSNELKNIFSLAMIILNDFLWQFYNF